MKQDPFSSPQALSAAIAVISELLNENMTKDQLSLLAAFLVALSDMLYLYVELKPETPLKNSAGQTTENKL